LVKKLVIKLYIGDMDR